MADGRWGEVDVTEAVELALEVGISRVTQVPMLVMGERVLLGATVLEDLDLLVDCARQRLVSNVGTWDHPVCRVCPGRECPMRHDGIAWLHERDAQVLLLSLVQAVEAPDARRETLRRMVADWRANAVCALEANDWTASVDTSLEVRVDARLSALQRTPLRE